MCFLLENFDFCKMIVSEVPNIQSSTLITYMHKGYCKILRKRITIHSKKISHTEYKLDQP